MMSTRTSASCISPALSHVITQPRFLAHPQLLIRTYPLLDRRDISIPALVH
jgi:hypothetical protein